MKKEKKDKNKHNNEFFEIDPSIIRYQHSKIKPVFSDGKLIDATIESIRNKEISVDDIPHIHVLIDKDENYYSLNNRRLYVFKKLHEEGLIKTIKVRLEQMPPNDTTRYNTVNCSLKAKYMYKVKKDEQGQPQESQPKEVKIDNENEN